MSFILDALKKSENDRQRQSGPALFEVRVPPPRSRFPLLAVAIIGLLVVNLGVVAWLMFRKPADAAVPQAQPAAAPQPQGATPQLAQTPPPPAYTAAPPTAQPPAAYPPGGATAYPPPQGGYYAQPQGAPPAGYGQQNAPPPNNYGQPPNGAYPNGNYPNGGYPNSGYQGQGQAYGNAAAYPPPAPAGEEPDAGARNPDDYEPARQPNPGLFGLGRAVRSTESGLPTYEEAAARATLPQLHLDLHSYAPDPTKRFVLVNMKRLYEGQATPEGVKVESITTDAAILSYQGTKFVLNRE